MNWEKITDSNIFIVLTEELNSIISKGKIKPDI